MGFGPEVAFNQLPASHLKSGLTQVVALKRLRKMGHGAVRTGDLRETSYFRAGKPGALLKSVYFFSREKIAFFTIFHRFEDFEDFWREKSLYVTAFAPK